MKHIFPAQLVRFALAFAWFALLAPRLGAALPPSHPRAEKQPASKTPVILDQDIGDDIDDTWALAFLLRSPDLDVRLVVGDHGKSTYRAKLIAKLLQTAGRTDIPVGVGLSLPGRDQGPQSAWVKDYRLEEYPGRVYRDGVQAIIDTIMQAHQRVTVIGTGPLPNLAAALKRAPGIARRARFVGMQGSVRRGYGNSPKPAAEYNVKADPSACRQVFAAPWPVRITPLDTCGIVQLTGERYRTVRDSTDPIARMVITNYRIWSRHHGAAAFKQARTASSTLFDTVAVYLASSDHLVKIEKLGLRVTQQGFTVLDPTAKKIEVATEWKDLPAFEDLLVQRLTSHPQ